MIKFKIKYIFHIIYKLYLKNKQKIEVLVIIIYITVLDRINLYH